MITIEDIINLPIGDCLIYHTGLLSFDRKYSKELSKLADYIYEHSNCIYIGGLSVSDKPIIGSKELVIFQEKKCAYMFNYIVKRVKKSLK